MGANANGDEATPTWLSSGRPLEVDIGTLAQFSKVLQDEVDQNFRPHAGHIFDGLDPAKSPFHRKDGFLELEVAWYVYGDCKAQTLNLVNDYINATAQLAEAARALASSYRNSDQLAQARLSDVQQAFDRAAPAPSDRLT